MVSTLNPINYRPGKLLRFWRKLQWFFTVYLPPRHEAITHTANGILAYDSKDKKTGRGLYVQRQFEYDFMHETIDFLQSIGALDKNNQGTVLDVGGYIGMSSTAFLLDSLFSRSIIFEPNPSSFHLIKKNIVLNNLTDRAVLFNIALSDTEGELLFELSEDNFGDHRIRAPSEIRETRFNEDQRKTISVEARTLDNVINASTFNNPDDIKLVWMDIQGHEGRFLKGAQNFLSSHPGVPVVMEFWPYAMNMSGQNKAGFIEICNALFNTFYLETESNKIKHPVSDLEKYYDRYNSPDCKLDGDTLILLNDHG